MTTPPASWVPNEVQRRNKDWRASVAKQPEGTAHSIATYEHTSPHDDCLDTFDVVHASADGVNKTCGWCFTPVRVTERKVLRVIDGMWQDMSVLPKEIKS